MSNAWYDENVITVCYEFLADILKNAPEETVPSGITRQDAILGPVVDVFLHESGHAMFDLLKVPVFGRRGRRRGRVFCVHRIAISQGGRSPAAPGLRLPV